MGTGRPVLRTSTLRRVTWCLWPWLNWLLPIAFSVFCVWRLIDTRGSTALVLAFASPVLIPAAGLLAGRPRRMLRDRGVRSTPRETVWLMMLQWWSWVGIALSLPDEKFTDAPESAPVPSLLQRTLGGSSVDVFSLWVLGGSLVVGIGSWVAITIFADRPLELRNPRRWDRLGAVAVLGAPLALVVVGSIGVGVSQLQVDTAREHPAQAVSRSAEDQVTRAQQRYAQIQAALAPVRSELAESRWSADRADVETVGATAFASIAYRFRIGFSHAATGDLTVDRMALMDVLGESGWEVSLIGEAPLTIDAHRADGTALRLRTDGDMPLRITVESGIWWQSRDEPVTSELASPGGTRGGGYDADDWPELR